MKIRIVITNKRTKSFFKIVPEVDVPGCMDDIVKGVARALGIKGPSAAVTHCQPDGLGVIWWVALTGEIPDVPGVTAGDSWINHYPASAAEGAAFCPRRLF